MIQWTERYNIFHASIAKGALTMSVAWNGTAPKGSPSGYVVSVMGRKITKLYPDAEQGKVAAVALAKKIVQEISQELG